MGQTRSYNGGDANFIIFSSQSINIIRDKHDEFMLSRLISRQKH